MRRHGIAAMMLERIAARRLVRAVAAVTREEQCWRPPAAVKAANA
jgi:hypothetical protein